MPAQSTPPVSATATALAIYQGMQRIGKKGASVAWAIPSITSNQFSRFNGVPVGVPAMNQNLGPASSWALFNLNPTQQSGSFEFGTALSFHIAICRIKAQIQSATELYIPGRFIVFDPDLNITYMYGSKEVSPICITTLTNLGQQTFGVYECENGDGQICVKQSSGLQLWVEMDAYANGAAPTSSFGNLTTAVITMFNFER